MEKLNNSYYQSGATLIVSLLLLVIITILSLSAMNSSVMEQKMAANEQYQREAFELSQSVVEATINSTTNFKVIGTAGYRVCYDNPDVLPACDAVYNVDSSFDNNADITGKITGEIIRLAPETIPAPRGIDTSLDKYDVALFQVNGSYDNSSSGFGQSSVAQGFMVLVPKTQ